MQDINVRFRQLRKKAGKTQTEWGKILGLSVSGVSEIEAGRRNVTDQHLIMLSNWKERNININWLKTGNGEMFLMPETNDLVARAAILLGEKDPIFESFIDTYSKLSHDNRETMINFLSDFISTINKRKKE